VCSACKSAQRQREEPAVLEAREEDFVADVEGTLERVAELPKRLRQLAQGAQSRLQSLRAKAIMGGVTDEMDAALLYLMGDVELWHEQRRTAPRRTPEDWWKAAKKLNAK
jgi:hypothetical protein